MPAANEIQIDGHCIRYGDDIILVSNISRMYIIQFFNRERKEYQDALKKYEERKKIYEAIENSKKTSRLRNSIIAAVLFLILTTVAFRIAERFTELQPLRLWGMFCLGIAAICILIAIITFRKKIVYDVEPPEEKPFPDRHGLFIEMNSGRATVFTALDEVGKQALRILRDSINEAVLQQTSIVFNMTENHIQLESNDGFISVGNDAHNNIIWEEKSNEPESRT